MKRCKVCRKKPKLGRRVDCEGVLFCSDDCYEEYGDSPNDHDHPYIDDYDAVRFEYMEWMKQYEEWLYKSSYYGHPKKAELIEDIDSIIDEFYDYYRMEGNDGVFSEEMYHYLLGFEELKGLIRNWEVDEKGLRKWRKVWERRRKERLERMMEL